MGIFGVPGLAARPLAFIHACLLRGSHPPQRSISMKNAPVLREQRHHNGATRAAAAWRHDGLVANLAPDSGAPERRAAPACHCVRSASLRALLGGFREHEWEARSRAMLLVRRKRGVGTLGSEPAIESIAARPDWSGAVVDGLALRSRSCESGRKISR